VRHITPERLDAIEGLLASARGLPGLVERKRGVFYKGSRAFLHFHEHGDDEIYADVRFGSDFERLRVTTKAERREFLRRLARAIS